MKQNKLIQEEVTLIERGIKFNKQRDEDEETKKVKIVPSAIDFKKISKKQYNKIISQTNNKTAIRYNASDTNKVDETSEEESVRIATPVEYIERPYFKRSYGKINFNKESSVKLLTNESRFPSLKTFRDLGQLRNDSKYSYNPLPKLSSTQSFVDANSKNQSSDKIAQISSRYSQRSLKKTRPASKIKLKPVIDFYALNIRRQQDMEVAKSKFGVDASVSQASLYT